jgi:hypothetical protein
MENALAKNWLPTKRWEEVSRGRNKSNRWVKIAHIDPWPFGNQELIHPKTTQEDETHTTTIVGSERLIGLGGATAGMQLKSAREVAELAEEMGKVLSDEKLLQVAEKLRREESGARKEVEKHEILAPVPERFDYYGFITIAELADEEIARQILENYRLTPTRGPLDVPMPGANLPGMGDKATVREILKSDLMKSYMTEEQIKEAEKAMGEMQKEVKEKFPKDIRFRKGKYQGSDAVFLTGKSQRTTPVGPGYLKESKDINKVFHSVRVGRFIVSGTLLRVVNALPLGASPCDSLKEFETKTEVMKEGGMTYFNKIIRPSRSTLAKEGYLHKEEADEIFSSVFKQLA